MNEDDHADAKQRLADHAALAKQVYRNNLSPYNSDVVYKSLFPYLQGALIRVVLCKETCLP